MGTLMTPVQTKSPFMTSHTPTAPVGCGQYVSELPSKLSLRRWSIYFGWRCFFSTQLFLEIYIGYDLVATLPVNGDSRFNLRYSLQPSDLSLRREGRNIPKYLTFPPKQNNSFHISCKSTNPQISSTTQKKQVVPSSKPTNPNPIQPTQPSPENPYLLPADTSRRSTADLFLRGGREIFRFGTLEECDIMFKSYRESGETLKVLRDLT